MIPHPLPSRYAVTNLGKSWPVRTTQTVTTSAVRPEGPTRVARIVYLPVPTRRLGDGIARQVLPQVSFQPRPSLRRVPKREEEGGLEPADRMASREQVSVQLPRVDDGAIRIRDLQSLEFPGQSMSSGVADCTDNAALQARGIAEARHERTLFPVACKRLFGAVVSGSAARGLAGFYTPARRATIGATISRLLSRTT